MWDIGGQESLRQAWNTYYTGAQFLILVVDSTDRERLSISKEELYKMLGHEVRVGRGLAAKPRPPLGVFDALRVKSHKCHGRPSFLLLCHVHTWAEP